MADAVIVDNNVAGYVLITTVITIITIILVYIFSNKGKETQLQNIKEDNQELEKNKNAGKSSKKRKGTAEKRKDVKTQFTHPWLLTTLKGHSGNVFDMDFSSNGKYLASCGEGGRTMANGKPRMIEDSEEDSRSRWNNNTKNSEPVSLITNDGFYLKRNSRTPLQMFQKMAYSEEEIYRRMLIYVLNTEEQKRYGYPVECPNEPGKAVILNGVLPHSVEVNEPGHHICCRCHSNFILTLDGKYEAENDCIYHWGKKKKIDLGNVSKLVYSCCDRESKTEGCKRSRYHVTNQVINLHGFVKTRSKKKEKKTKSYGVYALDCEMCFTLQGLEIAKISVVRPDGLTVYDALVLPEKPVIDYNTSFSGIAAKDLKDVRTTLADVHAILLKLFNSNTILIGHGLENDLKALRLIHETVIDTSIVFPHRLGPPYRRSLKSLINHYLHQTIQENGTGHDSSEDARSCMDLMMWKIYKDKYRYQKQQKSRSSIRD